jgi:hypothetical protein
MGSRLGNYTEAVHLQVKDQEEDEAFRSGLDAEIYIGEFDDGGKCG